MSQFRDVFRLVLSVLATVAVPGVCDGASRGDLIADSIAGHSGVQGQGGWYYGFYNDPFTPAGFQQMTVFGDYGGGGYINVWSRSAIWGPGNYWTNVGPNDLGHPNGFNGNVGTTPELNWAVRRWVSDFDGPVMISARLRKQNTNFGNGVVGHLFVDGMEVWSAAIGAFDGVGVVVDHQACLAKGSIVDFALDPNNGDDAADGSYFGFTVRGPVDLAGDANFDLLVSFPDIISVLSHWDTDYGSSTGDGDADHDGIVSFPDVTAVLANWGENCP